MTWVRNDTRLEDSSKICRCHSVEVRFGREDCEKIKDVEE